MDCLSILSLFHTVICDHCWNSGNNVLISPVDSLSTKPPNLAKSHSSYKDANHIMTTQSSYQSQIPKTPPPNNSCGDLISAQKSRCLFPNIPSLFSSPQMTNRLFSSKCLEIMFFFLHLIIFRWIPVCSTNGLYESL